jgi:hypothetical protein
MGRARDHRGCALRHDPRDERFAVALARLREIHHQLAELIAAPGAASTLGEVPFDVAGLVNRDLAEFGLDQ